jgi:predicted signal transduction protein with EAL and GGDEF domain
VKRCRKCGEIRPFGDFYAHPRSADRLFGTCKPCTRAAARARETANREARARWRAGSKEKIAAHSAVAAAVKSGRLERLPCEVCGAAESEAHHDDYARPLAVVWLCPEHHGERHRMMRRRAEVA